MAVVVHYEFLKKLAEIKKSAYQKSDGKIISNLEKISTLFMALQVKPIILQEELEIIYNKKKNNENLKHHEQWMINLHKQSMSSVSNLDLISNSDFYFLNSPKVENIEHKFGVIVKGLDFDGTDFYNKASHAINLPLKNWSDFKDHLLPTNAILIIDPYIFGNPFKIKLKKLKQFIGLIKSHIQEEYHITIITSTHKLKNKIWVEDITLETIEEALEEFKKEDIYVEIYAYNQDEIFMKKHGKNRDREFFTNYSTITIGHPFDNTETKITQNFLGHSNDIKRIKTNYDNYQRDLKKWLNIINDIKKIEATSNLKLSWRTKKFSNRIFENIQ